MLYLDRLAHDVVGLVRYDRGWMAWNLALAVLPAILAVVLFPHRGARSRWWWAGVAAFALFLPNAPYVVTDLVHLYPDYARSGSKGLLLVGILPLYAAFVLAGYLAYALALDRVVQEVQATRRKVPRWVIELPVHLACAVGIVLGRVARLNSWDTLTHPTSTVERTFSALSFDRAPYWIAAVFAAVTITYSAVRIATVAARHAADQVGDHLRQPAPTP